MSKKSTLKVSQKLTTLEMTHANIYCGITNELIIKYFEESYVNQIWVVVDELEKEHLESKAILVLRLCSWVLTVCKPDGHVIVNSLYQKTVRLFTCHARRNENSKKLYYMIQLTLCKNTTMTRLMIAAVTEVIILALSWKNSILVSV